MLSSFEMYNSNPAGNLKFIIWELFSKQRADWRIQSAEQRWKIGRSIGAKRSGDTVVSRAVFGIGFPSTKATNGRGHIDLIAEPILGKKKRRQSDGTG